MRARIITGFDELDKMLDGGIPQGSQVLLTGGPGTGKTLMGFEFAYKNAKAGNNGIIFSLEEDEREVVENAISAFTEFKDIQKLMDSGKILIYDAKKIMEKMYGDTEPTRARFTADFFKNFRMEIAPLIKEANAKVVVIDNLAVLKLFIKDPFEYRTFTVELSDVLKASGVTSLIISEVFNPHKSNMVFEQEFFAYDGIIVMYFIERSVSGREFRGRAIEVMEMRGSKHSFETVPYEITSSGFSITKK